MERRWQLTSMFERGPTAAQPAGLRVRVKTLRTERANLRRIINAGVGGRRQKDIARGVDGNAPVRAVAVNVDGREFRGPERDSLHRLFPLNKFPGGHGVQPCANLPCIKSALGQRTATLTSRGCWRRGRVITEIRRRTRAPPQDPGRPAARLSSSPGRRCAKEPGAPH